MLSSTTSIAWMSTILALWTSRVSVPCDCHHLNHRSDHDTCMLSIQGVKSLWLSSVQSQKWSRYSRSEHPRCQIPVAVKICASKQINPDGWGLIFKTKLVLYSPRCYLHCSIIFLQLGRQLNRKIYYSGFLEKTSGSWIFMTPKF